jgi:hypothetical protein
MSHRIHKHPGAPVGNQNARKHGYYSKVITASQAAALPAMSQVKDLDNEIALVRVKISDIQAHNPQNFDLLLRATSLLERLYRTREGLARLDAQPITRIHEGIVSSRKAA